MNSSLQNSCFQRVTVLDRSVTKTKKKTRWTLELITLRLTIAKSFETRSLVREMLRDDTTVKKSAKPITLRFQIMPGDGGGGKGFVKVVSFS